MSGHSLQPVSLQFVSLRSEPSSFAAVPFVSLAVLAQGCDSAEPAAREMVVHTTLRPPNQDIYLVEGPGAEPRRLTDHPALDYNATFSPDGTRIAWVRRETALRGPNRLLTEVRVMSADGSGGRLLVDGGETIAGAPAWSPDGSDRRPAYDGTELAVCLAPAYDGNGRLACHGPGPTDGMPIMANGRPFQRPGTHWGVSLPDREIRVTGIRGYFPDFLPDGRLVYGEWINDEADIAEFGMPPLITTRVDGTDRRVVFHRDDRQPWAPSACDDGSWIAFNEGRTFAPVDEDVDVWKVRPDGTGAVNLTADSDANDAFPAWTPDCRTIVFRSGRDGDKEIYRMDAEGGNVERLTRREGVETVPDVSPDGEWIEFATDQDGAGIKIWIQRLDGSERRFLESERAGTPGIDMHPRFSPDGQWVAFVSDRRGMADEFLLTDDPQPYGDIWAVPVEGGEAVRLTDDKWEDGLPRWGRIPDR